MYSQEKDDETRRGQMMHLCISDLTVADFKATGADRLRSAALGP